MNRCVLCFAIFCGLMTSTVVGEEPASLIRKFCADCHGSDNQEAELDLVSLVVTPGALRRDFKQLGRIVRVIESGEMPPEDSELQPSDEERRQLASWLKSEIAAIAEAERDDPGIVVMPRLARVLSKASLDRSARRSPSSSSWVT